MWGRGATDVPVRLESVVFASEHGAHVGGMLSGGVEVSEVTYTYTTHKTSVGILSLLQPGRKLISSLDKSILNPEI